MTIGSVKLFTNEWGYGAIQPHGFSADSFVHISDLQAAGMAKLDKEQCSNCEVETRHKGEADAVYLTAADSSY